MSLARSWQFAQFPLTVAHQPRAGCIRLVRQIGVNLSIHQVDRVFFMESSQSRAALLNYYSTEPLTTGPDYDPLLLLLALSGDLHPNQDRQGTPARSVSRTSLAKVSTTCVQDARIGYIQDVHVRHDVQHTTVERQWHRQQTDGTKHLPPGAQRQSGGHSGVQAHGKIEKSQHPELHPRTTGSTLRPMRHTVFYP